VTDLRSSERKIAMVLLPMESGRKTRHIALLRHGGGGWYTIQCMGEGKRCKAGECKHTANMAWGKPGGRPVRQIPRDEVER
jgi:hypothetical protein